MISVAVFDQLLKVSACPSVGDCTLVCAPDDQDDIVRLVTLGGLGARVTVATSVLLYPGQMRVLDEST